MTQIKICGVRTPQIAQKCIQLGAHFVGLVFDPNSPRYVSLDEAIAIAAMVHKEKGIPVAVFNHADVATIRTVCKQTGITHVQLHGEKAKAELYDLPESLQKIYVITVNPLGELTYDKNDVHHLRPEHDFILFDGVQAGSGQKVVLTHIQSLYGLRFFLAGGLTVDTVQAAICTTHPYAVDVSSGVELTRGEKSADLIAQFITKVREQA